MKMKIIWKFIVFLSIFIMSIVVVQNFDKLIPDIHFLFLTELATGGAL